MSNNKSTIKVTDESFDKVTKEGVSLVDFWAPWCGPCRIQGPIIEKVAENIGGKANICKLDVDSNQETANKYGITNIPTILLFKGGEIMEHFVGLQNDATLIAAVEKHL